MEMELYSGRFVDVTNLTVDDICWEDIITPLVRQCRYGNHSQVFYSVAHHLVLGYEMARWLGFRPEHRRYFLMHDLHEAYVMDVPRPLKAKLKNYDAIEAHAERVVREWLDYPEPSTHAAHMVHRLDLEMLYWEGQYVMHNTQDWAAKFRQFDTDFSRMEHQFRHPDQDIAFTLSQILHQEFGGVGDGDH